VGLANLKRGASAFIVLVANKELATSSVATGRILPIPTFPSFIMVSPLPTVLLGCILANKPLAFVGAEVLATLKKPLVEFKAVLEFDKLNPEPVVIELAVITWAFPIVAEVLILSAFPAVADCLILKHLL